jgi:hypothetical protein
VWSRAGVRCLTWLVVREGWQQEESEWSCRESTEEHWGREKGRKRY